MSPPVCLGHQDIAKLTCSLVSPTPTLLSSTCFSVGPEDRANKGLLVLMAQT